MTATGETTERHFRFRATTGAFWLGVSMIVAGVVLHLREFLAMSGDRYRMAGMEISLQMGVGMTLLAGGLVMAVVAVVRAAPVADRRPAHGRLSVDDRRLGRMHGLLLAVMSFGMIVDTMKPASIGFVIPGASREYGLTVAQVSAWPLIALTGTALGSILWGALADRIGRRASVLLAALLFITTSVCGAMPHYWLNLVTCFFMGLSAGGFLPLVFTVISEFLPARHRGWTCVLVGTTGTTGGYLAAAFVATAIVPMFSWRVLWLVGLPTGVAVLLLSWFVPESPRYLLSVGAVKQARRVMSKFGITLTADDAPAPPRNLRSVLAPGYRVLTLVLGLLGLSWGLVNFGFLTWLPTMLSQGASTKASAVALLARSALLALPGALVAALLYGLWSARRTLALSAVAIVVSLFGIGMLVLGSTVNLLLLSLLLLVLLLCVSACGTMLSVYSSEVYPTAIRGTGTGTVAGAMKCGGIVGPPLVAVLMQVGPAVTTSALLLSVPIAVGALVFVLYAAETTGRRLEEITAEGPGGARFRA